jgi:hypothetical protein
MTPEEAAEVILKGEAWQPCPGCEGKGEFESKDGLGVIEYFVCVRCDGNGYWRTDEYAEACVVLEREYPKKKMSGREMKEWFAKSFEKFPLREALTRPSMLRMILPPQLITKVDDEES